jgi:hypothetical protein
MNTEPGGRMSLWFIFVLIILGKMQGIIVRDLLLQQ